MRLRLTPRATHDLEDIAAFTRARNPAAAQTVKAALQGALQLLAAHPLAGRVLVKRRRRFSVPRLPYLIYYRVDDRAEIVTILTIRHAARLELR